ncbi:MAG: Fic family protein [Gemmatimonadetes bacterium]|nr:Fic family protein [Gemmatimonadota bacterium]
MAEENLMGDSSREGALRKREVLIGNSVYRPSANQYQIKEWFEELAVKAGAITDPLEQSFFLLVHLPYLQPFTDVNKRTSRVMANLPIVKAELCPLSFLDVSREAYAEGLLGVYEFESVDLIRDVFVWAYERSCQQYRTVIESVGEPNPIRQKYRNAMREMVHQAIGGGARPDAAELQKWARDNAQAREDAVPLFDSIRGEFENLRPELAARYSLRAEVVEEWLRDHGST